MATRSTFYLDGLNLSSSKSVYSDEQLTTLASDGWYSDDVIARRQIGGVLQAVEQCDNCSEPEVVEIATVYIVNGDCATGDPSDPFDSKVWVDASWSGFTTNVSGKLVVNNTALFAEIPTRYYDPFDSSVSISDLSITTSASPFINPNNNTGDGVYLTQENSLKNATPNIKATVSSNADPTLSTVTFEVCPCDNCSEPEVVEIATVYIVNGDCATGDPSDPFDSKVWVDASWSGFTTNVSGKLVVNNTALFAEIPTRYYDPFDSSVSISDLSITTSASPFINPNNNTGDGVYLTQENSLKNATPNIKATVSSNADPTLSTVTFEVCP